MKVLMFILRFIFGLTFILSGFFKLVDPVGTGLIVKEYFGMMHLKFLSFSSVPFGMILSVLELLVGIAMVMRMRMKIASLVGLVMTSIFTVITLFLLIFNPIQDCGCFGEAIHLSNTQTFIKNLILLACIVPIFFYRKRFRRVAPNGAEWTFLMIYGAIAVIVTTISYFRMPVADFGYFKTGTNIAVRLDEAAQDNEFESVFIYSKNGKTQKFKIDEIPDSTWTFISSEEISKRRSSRAAFDFSVSDKDGHYFTDELVNSQDPVIICAISDIEKFDSMKNWARLLSIADAVRANHGELIVLTSSSPTHVQEVLSTYGPSFPINFGYCDYKTIVSLHRNNGGFVYLDDAVVIKKWSKRGLDADDAAAVIDKDSEIVMARDIIKRQLIYEISIVAIFLSIILMRYICGLVYSRKQKFFA